MRNRTVIIQSNYIPWRGYFDLLAHADTVVLFDSVQSTKNDWRNRNMIKCHDGKAWLTIPVRHSNELRIRDVKIATQGWHLKHLRTIRQSYARAPFAAELLPEIERWYTQAGHLDSLSAVNRIFLFNICHCLGIECRFVEVQDILADEDHDRLEPSARLVEICRRIGTSAYLSGPAARNYLDAAQFDSAGIGVEWFDYDGYPEYPQLHGPFDPAVSILDLLLMNGPDSSRFALRDMIS